MLMTLQVPPLEALDYDRTQRLLSRPSVYTNNTSIQRFQEGELTTWN